MYSPCGCLHFVISGTLIRPDAEFTFTAGEAITGRVCFNVYAVNDARTVAYFHDKRHMYNRVELCIMVRL